MVITDVSAAFHDRESIESNIKEVEISSVVLECLRRQAKCPPPLIPLPSQTSQALVLYRAPRSEPLCGDQEGKRTGIVQEDDVMDVE